MDTILLFMSGLFNYTVTSTEYMA